MAISLGQSFNMGSYGKLKKNKFSETRNFIEPKRFINNHWIGPLCGLAIQNGHQRRTSLAY